MINVVILMGRLTADPELKSTSSGISVTSFSIAVNRRYSKDGNNQTDFINCVAWRRNAEFISKYFSKGQMIAIRGSLQQNSYTDKDGNKRTVYEVIIDTADFCGSKSESKEENSTAIDDDFENVDFGELENLDINENGDLPF